MNATSTVHDTLTIEHHGRTIRVDLSPQTDEVIFTAIGETQEARFMSLHIHPDATVGLTVHHGFQSGCGVEKLDDSGYILIDHG